MLGKLDVPLHCLQMIEESGDIPLPFSPEAADGLRAFSSLSRHDPFYLMLLAQAKSANLTLMTADEALLTLDLPYVIDARL